LEIAMHVPFAPDLAPFESQRARLRAISLRIVGNRFDADDVVQDCYFKWRDADRASLATPAAWLTTVVQHLSVDRLRQRAREAAVALAAVETAVANAAVPPLPDDALLRHAALADALARLHALSPAERLALVLHEVFECRHEDIAAVLGTTAANARQHLSRARRRLRAREEGLDPSHKQSRELVRQFQAAINGLDVPAMVSLLADEQPMAVRTGPPARLGAQDCANDACYRVLMAA
jgi:RNA polymerase sigma factor (sigma-70 family)